MNKDHLQPFIDISTKNYGDPYKVTETDEIINYCWKRQVYPNDSDYEFIYNKIQQHIDLKGWVMTPDEQDEAFKMYIKDVNAPDWSKGTVNKITRSFFSITYNKTKDKLSIGEYEKGYGWTHLKSRLYPISKSIPRLCLSKKLYAFYPKRIRHARPGKYQHHYTYKPRIYTGKLYTDLIGPYVCQFLKIQPIIAKIHIPYRMMTYGGRDISPYNTVLYYNGVVSKDNFSLVSEQSLKLSNPIDQLQDVNSLIEYAGGYQNVDNLLSLAHYRLSEGLSPTPEGKPQYELLKSCMSFLNGEWPEDLKCKLPVMGEVFI